MRSRVIVCLFVSVLFLSGPKLGNSQAPGAPTHQSTSPVGRWQTVDDVTGKAKSIIAIWEQNSRLYGRIEKLIDPDPGDSDPRCNRCDGEMKGRPLLGLRILWDLRKLGDEWSGGKILDPENGKTYKCSIGLEEGGQKLRVRGFIGFPLLGRTQYWLREE